MNIIESLNEYICTTCSLHGLNSLADEVTVGSDKRAARIDAVAVVEIAVGTADDATADDAVAVASAVRTRGGASWAAGAGAGAIERAAGDVGVDGAKQGT